MGNKKKSIVIKKKICEPSCSSSSSSSSCPTSSSCETLCDPSSCSSSSSSCSSPRTRVIIVDPSKCSDSCSSSSSSSSCSSSDSSCSDSSCSDCGGKKKEKKCNDNRKGHCGGNNNRCGCGNCGGGCGGNNGGCGGGGCCTNNGGCCGGNAGCVVKVNARVMGNSFTPYCSTPAPVSNLSLIKGNSCGTVPFHVSINCRTVTISWDGFSGQVDSSGAAYIYIRQCFAGLPSSNTFGSFLINVKGTDLLSVVEVNSTNGDTIRWYFYPTRKGTNISRSDSFTIYPGSITYVLASDC